MCRDRNDLVARTETPTLLFSPTLNLFIDAQRSRSDCQDAICNSPFPIVSGCSVLQLKFSHIAAQPSRPCRSFPYNVSPNRIQSQNTNAPI
ncbi:hypothetical protein MTP99_019256 [Tenebrio molitor]|nr:hypothetical protein MTP99_019256 [Tenebrio molitor]